MTMKSVESCQINFTEFSYAGEYANFYLKIMDEDEIGKKCPLFVSNGTCPGFHHSWVVTQRDT